ncbi:MXAN_6577-like cysteine-rich protein [Hyalangium versicolor]|uniref:MXAN_6577-like cysteine-rich protein n=1 Tax=Hyalangium versicolor TaxID=2861190 RepID=UPI002105F895|nr:MXAN_6577-like cysteine-rich protein [Hyalangium versicolor]
MSKSKPFRTLLVVVWAVSVLGTGCGDSDPPPSSCSTGQQCGGVCVDTQSSLQHCGGCDQACSAGQVCSQGACKSQCAQGQTECGGTCVDTRSNVSNCGSCGTACSESQVCKDGGCVLACSEDQEVCGGTCVDTKSSSEHCGGCNQACTGGKVCVSANCVSPCLEGQEWCGGACVDTQSNSQHCGGCNQACTAGLECRGGSCGTPCPQGQRDCNGTCVDTGTDPQNCGTCGTACNPGHVCSSGTCGGCQSGLTSCGQSCIDTQTDPQNCGVCGKACSSGQSCLQGVCKVATSCASSLIAPVKDAWDTSWDGLERIANTYAAAKQTCEGLGARLPTASELFLVNAKRLENIGATSTNYLWSLAPYGPATQHTVRLSDGLTSTAAVSTSAKQTYRCVCPSASAPESFSGNACFGSPGKGCFALKEGGGRYNMDGVDRPLLSKNGAVWECTYQRAHLADYGTYVAAIVAGLPGGNASWYHTGDDARSSKDVLIKWTGVQKSWIASGNTTASTLTASRSFRCVGVNYAAGTHPNTVVGEFVGLRSGYKGEGSNPVQAVWEVAHDTCWNRGGHLPRSTELAALIQEGLPNGDNSWLWTSDQAGYNGTQFLAMTLRWSGSNKLFGYYNSDYVSTVYKTGTPPDRPFRCIYYPLDAQYAGPAEQSCQGGCMRFQLSGATPAVVWMDMKDRSLATLEGAMSSCSALGGRLASSRDHTEAIRHSLPNGSGQYLLTSDLTYDDRSTTQTPVPYVSILKWTAVNTGFNDQYSAYSTWGVIPTATASTRPYRCMWTNELR